MLRGPCLPADAEKTASTYELLTRLLYAWPAWQAFERRRGREFGREIALEGEAPCASRAPEIPLPFPSNACQGGYLTLHLRPISTDAFLATHVNAR